MAAWTTRLAMLLVQCDLNHMGKGVAHHASLLAGSLGEQMLLEPGHLRSGGTFAVFASESVGGASDHE